MRVTKHADGTRQAVDALRVRTTSFRDLGRLPSSSTCVQFFVDSESTARSDYERPDGMATKWSQQQFRAEKGKSTYFSQNTFQSDEIPHSMQNPFFDGVTIDMCGRGWSTMVRSCETHVVKAHVGETRQVIVGRVIVREIISSGNARPCSCSGIARSSMHFFRATFLPH